MRSHTGARAIGTRPCGEREHHRTAGPMSASLPLLIDGEKNRVAAPAIFIGSRNEATAQESMVLRPEMDARVP